MTYVISFGKVNEMLKIAFDLCHSECYECERERIRDRAARSKSRSNETRRTSETLARNQRSAEWSAMMETSNVLVATPINFSRVFYVIHEIKYYSFDPQLYHRMSFSDVEKMEDRLVSIMESLFKTLHESKIKAWLQNEYEFCKLFVSPTLKTRVKLSDLKSWSCRFSNSRALSVIGKNNDEKN